MSALGRLGWRLVPSRCLLCEGRGTAVDLDLCAHCLAMLPEQIDPWRADAHPLSAVLAPWRYEYPVDALIRALKFHGALANARLFGTLLARRRQCQPAPLPQRVLPMPLHSRRLRQRGFNQALEIARFAARELQLPVDSRALRRTRHTGEQARLPASARGANVQGAFHADGRIAGLRVALVDDVMTTGSTAGAAAAALAAAGAVAVEIWVLARVQRRANDAARIAGTDRAAPPAQNNCCP